MATFRQTCISVVGRPAVGLTTGVLSFRVVRSLLDGMTGVDPAMIALVVALFPGAGLVAGFLPARRGASVDPVDTLRME